MKKSLLLIACVAALLGSACSKQAATPVATAIAETGGSRQGDFGPPQGAAIHAVLTSPPQVPPATNRKAPAKVIVDLEVKEVEKEISEGVTYTFWTFGGTVPGSFIRVRQGDTVEFHLKNHPTSKMPHNIDLHGVTGPGGGAASSFTAPGHQTQFTFKALNQGLYVYHCATAPVGMHVANGMYGLILVEPPQGLSPVDHEYYVMQGDFYTVGKYREKGFQAFDMQKAIDENATYVLFNGSESALTGPHALKAKTGESVRLFVGNGGPNLVSSFHVIGEIFDKVQYEGGTHFQENVQTTLIPAGGAATVEFHTEVPGNYVLVDHSIFRAFNKGALAIMEVTGDPQLAIYSGKQVDETYLGDKVTSLAAVSTAQQSSVKGTLTKEQQIAAGSVLFKGTCSTCHQENGEGIPNVFPPLAKSDFLHANPQRAIEILLNGLTGPVTVNGSTYNSVMPPMSQLNDDEIANILTFALNSWGNKGPAVNASQVTQARASTKRPEGGEKGLRETLPPRKGRTRYHMSHTVLTKFFLGLMLIASAATAAASERPVGTPVPTVAIPAGQFESVLPPAAGVKKVSIAAFRIDVTPVTNEQFARFVAAHPQWRRDRIARIFGDGEYLSHWASPAGPNPQQRDQPVVHVSWFAANAYCESRGGRLPTWYEWEYVAAASETATDARQDDAWRQRILGWYAKSATATLPTVGKTPANFYGVRDLHGVVWEWVDDVSAMLVSGDNRQQSDPDALRFCGPGALTMEQKENYATLMRIAMLSSMQASYTSATMGFRCALDNGARR